MTYLELYTQALKSLVPGVGFSCSLLENNEVNVTVYDSSVSIPSSEVISNEIARLQAEYDAKAYQRSRAAEYPPITDYLDGVVKGDQAQIDKYIADCLAVKAKYPKP